MVKNISKLLIFIVLSSSIMAKKAESEDDFYKIQTLPIPEGIFLEIGGMAVLPDGRLAVCTRRGEVWMISNPYMFGGKPTYKLIAEGLHEPLGLNFIDSKLWTTQRGEVTILHDDNKDETIDRYQRFYSWPLSGNYHQYSYGPVLMPDGKMLFTLNLDWIGRGASQSKWRGWMFKLDKEANMEPFATGLRSPAGFMVNDVGDIFYAENQGDWVGSGRITHLEKGDVAGNPSGLVWSGEPNSPTKLKVSDIPDTGEPLYEVAQRVEGLKPPAVWFPHTLMGISTSDIVQDTEGAFGPFKGQYFVGDQGHSKIMRMSLEKVDGVYQGACYPFREGFQSGVLRMRWGLDNSMFVGQTSRGWASTGKSDFGLQRLVYTGALPFEVKEINSSSDGFVIHFTKPIDPETVKSEESIGITSFTYKFHHYYGSPIINQSKINLKAIKLTEDRMSLQVAVDKLPLGYIFGFDFKNIKAEDQGDLLHETAYFTLNRINKSIPGIDVVKYAVMKAEENHAQHHSMEITDIKSEKRISEIPADWNGKVDETIIISTKPGLKFDKERVVVKAGSKVKLVLNNNDDMLHNLLITNPGKFEEIGQMALQMGMQGPEKAYVPDSDEVLYHTGMIQPESTETIYFIAPKSKGDYHFVCTFPGHYTVMNGIFRVR